MINHELRNKYFQQQQHKKLLSSLAEAGKKDNKLQADKLDKIGKAIAILYSVVKRPLVLPKIFPVKGEVEIKNKPTVYIQNFSELDDRMASLESSIKKISSAISMMPSPEIRMPTFTVPEVRVPEIKIPEIKVPTINIPQIKVPDIHIPPTDMSIPKEIVQSLKSLQDEIELMKRQMTIQVKKGNAKVSLPDFSELTTAMKNLELTLLSKPTEAIPGRSSRKMEELLGELVNRPQMTPQPITNININPLQGLIKTTDNTVGSTVTKLPQYGQLFNRRAVQIYNNSGNTIYIGGSDVTVANGIPVPANSYSNILDAGYNMIVYAIASQNGNDVRVMEVASTSAGGVAIQE